MLKQTIVSWPVIKQIVVETDQELFDALAGFDKTDLEIVAVTSQKHGKENGAEALERLVAEFGEGA